MYRRDMASYLSYDDWASQNIIEYAAGKGFDNMGGSGGGMWGSWSSTPIFGLVQGRKPRYETEGYDYMELGIVGYQWSYTPGNGGSPFDQVMGDPAVSSAGSPIGEWGGGQEQQDPNMARLLTVVDQNGFYGEKHEINWIIDYDGKETTKDAPGATEPWLTEGKRNVYVHPSAFESSGKLYIVLGHEYVHTLDHDNGVFKNALAKYNQTIAHYYLEYRAYKWGALAESELGISIGQQFYRDFFKIKLNAAIDGFKK